MYTQDSQTPEITPAIAGRNALHHVNGKGHIAGYYQDEQRALHYIDDRFSKPMGRLLHHRQVAALRHAVWRYSPRSILEIAGGPARLTAEVARFFEGEGMMIDASQPMLEVARQRLAAVKGGERWRLLAGNAFDLPSERGFDLIYSFRFIRHFQAPERAQLYRQIHQRLAPDGVFVFDAVNESVSAPLRRAQPEAFPVYDALFTPERLRAELRDQGFDVTSMHAVWHRYDLLSTLSVTLGPRFPNLTYRLLEWIDRHSQAQPMEWIVVCRRV